jgi:hypothetical protein
MELAGAAITRGAAITVAIRNIAILVITDSPVLLLRDRFTKPGCQAFLNPSIDEVSDLDCPDLLDAGRAGYCFGRPR